MQIDLRPEGAAGSPAVRRFSVPVQPNGEWSFDFRALVRDRPGDYAYLVWASTPETSSPGISGAFTVLPLRITGFEGIAQSEALPLEEARDTGIVFRATGPANGQVCLLSVWTGQHAAIQLDGQGVAVQRIRLLSWGTYFLNFRACEGEHQGPAEEFVLDVHDEEAPIFGPWGPDEPPAEFLLEPVEG